MSIASRIVELLTNNPALKAKDIADRLRADRSEVNSALYGPLKGQVTRNDSFAWSLVGQTTPRTTRKGATDECDGPGLPGELAPSPSLPTRYPVSEYYRNAIVDGITVGRRGPWWTAVLLIRSPRNCELTLNLYRWENVDGKWKTRQLFKIRNGKPIDKLLSAMTELRGRM